MPLSTAGIPVEVEKASTVGSGVDAVINLPSTLLRQYDVIVDYPAGTLTIGVPGSLHFKGRAIKAYIHPKNALIQVPASMDSDNFNIALDLGTPVSLVRAI